MNKDRKKSSLTYLLIIISCCGMVAASIGLYINAYGIFFTPMADALGVRRGDISMHATLCGLATGVIGIPVIHWMQSHRVRPVILAGVALTAAATVLTAFSSKVWQLNVLGILRGAGLCCFNLGIVTMVIGNWFEARRGTVTGLIASFSGLSGAVFNPIFNALILRFGYRSTLIIMSVVTLVLALPAILFVELNPMQKGMVPYGHGSDEAEEMKKGDPYRRGDAPGEKVQASAPAASGDEPGIVPLRYFSALFLTTCVLVFFANFSIGFASHLPGVAESAGYTSSFGALLVSVVMIANISFKFVIGYLADRLGAVRASQLMLAVELTGIVLMFFVLGSVSSGAALMAAGFLFGSSYSFGAVGMSLVTRRIYGGKQYGSAYAVTAMVGNVSNALAIAAIGYAYDFLHSYRPVAAVLILMVASCIALLGICEKRRKQQAG
ncbi:MAG: MFS transporter [Lachnospiraceae bacterium]|nr:MFS transporter [Lachnospiraceae bacterium]